MSDFELGGLDHQDRRSVLKILGSSGVVAAGTGLGLTAFSGSGAAASVDITATSPEAVQSDDGKLERVFIEPTLDVVWDGFDDVVGKVRLLVEAATGAVDLDPPEIESLDYLPVFRATGYANGTDNDVEEETGPGTHGEFHLDWFAGDKDVTLFDQDGAPDYENATYTCGATMESYLDGTLLGDPIDGAQNGFYGAAGTTDEFEEATDSGSNTTTVYLRYTVSLHAPDITFRTEDNYDIAHEELKPFSPIVMPAGEEGQYPDLTNQEWGSTVTSDTAADYQALSAGDFVAATAVPYGAMQDNTDHPAIMTAYADFDVTVDNQPADAGVSGDSGAGAEVDDDVDTITGDGTDSSANDTTADDTAPNLEHDGNTTDGTVANETNTTVADDTNGTVANGTDGTNATDS